MSNDTRTTYISTFTLRLIVSLSLSFSWNRYVYNPLSYASSPHRAFLRKYLRGRRETLFLGMNPGPWGMMQTGVPFGEVSSVTGFLGLDPTLPVLSPARYHPSRPVAGFGCKRKEVSGERLWGLIEDLCQVYNIENFFATWNAQSLKCFKSCIVRPNLA